MKVVVRNNAAAQKMLDFLVRFSLQNIFTISKGKALNN
jgi:hypothetical protein